MSGVTAWLLPLSPWTWLVAAALLAGLEIIAPGAFMIWLAGAAAVSAGIAALFAPPWAAQLMIFVGLAVASVLIGREWLRRRPPATQEPGLNRRGERILGSLVTVVEPLVAGIGRVQLGDSPWPARGPDLAAGSRARIVGIEGNTLVIEAA